MQIYFLFNQLYFWLGSLLVSILYLRTICFIRNRTRNGSSSLRIDSLSNIFSSLILAWILTEGPYAVYTLSEYFLWEFSGCNSRDFLTCNPIFCKNFEVRMRVAEQVCLSLKNFFPVVNTILVIILIRQLHRPILRSVRFIRNKKK